MRYKISIHETQCTIKSQCLHGDICYFVNGKHGNLDPKIFEKVDNVIDNPDAEIFYSLCSVQNIYRIVDKLKNKNFNLTLPINVYEYITKNLKIDLPVEQLQVTCTSYNQIYNLNKNIKKLILIKDEKTLDLYKQCIKHNICNVHFPIDKNYVSDNPEALREIIFLWNNKKEKTISLDSCLENYLLNSTCIYQNDYIDLRFDGTYRKCPFSDECHPITNNINEMVKTPFTPKCLYSKLFSRK